MDQVRENILRVYESMTPVERSIADFFGNNEKAMDFSSRNIAKLLYISEATLSRFAKKCGYKGYREFIYDYEKELQERLRERNISVLSRRVRNTYARLLEEAFRQLDEESVKKVAAMLNRHDRVFVCGMGSSGYAAREFYLRFMRLGLEVQALTDPQVISMTMAVAGRDCAVIGITLSGRTKEILGALRAARERGAETVIITANRDYAGNGFCDAALLAAADQDLDGGTAISPQFPVLVLIDVLYTYYIKNDAKGKIARWNETLRALREPLESIPS
ncbi:MAG: MurR/RpiR family transcriptional regulator [Eubacteriales bacterium]|nr:MurR/RpiR family transcriptional regulator [Eubacteriales bacterium]